MKDYPFIKFALLFVIGILVYKVFQPEALHVLLFIIFLLSVFYIIKIYGKGFTTNRLKLIIYSLVFVSSGLLIAIFNYQELDSPLSRYIKEKNARLFAEVVKIELEKSYEIVFKVKTDSIFIDDKVLTIDDKLICKFRGDSLKRRQLYDQIYPGNKIYLTGTYQKGREKRNPGEFDYNAYLYSKGITGLFISYDTDSVKIISNERNYFKSIVYQVRKSIDKIIHDLHQPETAGLLRGLLLADRSEIDYETKNEFINSGVVHILAVSGLHVGYILIIFIFIFGRFGIYLRSSLIILGLLGFMFLTGIPPSVFRATLMAIIIILAFLSNRTTNIINSISIAAIIILLFDPNEIYNPGFQLSFSAVLAIGILYPRLQQSIFKMGIKNKWLKYILLFCAVSLSAQIGTLPFTLTYFSKLSIVALFTNLLVIPTVGVIIGVAFITIIIGLISYPLAIYFALVNDLFSGLMFDLIRFTGNLDFSFLWIREYSLFDSIVFYSFAAFLLFAFSKIRSLSLKIIVGVLSIFSIVFYSSLDNKNILEENKLNILMIDVGQGDSFLIRFPNGKTALIDAGEANPFIDNGERVIIPLLDYLGIDKIDYGFISHLDLDHYGGFVSLIYNDRIKEIYRPLPDSSEKSNRFEKFLRQKQIKTNIFTKSIIDIGNTKIYILNDPYDYSYSNLSSNDKSGILKIVYGATSYLFVGDCEYPGEFYLTSKFGQMLNSDVLKVGHHGSPTGSSKAFLNLVSPEISLVSAGIKNKFNHPAKSVIASLENLNSKIFRTDLMGAVLLQSDGEVIKKINWK